MNRGFVLLAEDYVKHDIYLMKIVERMDTQLTHTFGDRYRLLRNVFEDQANLDGEASGESRDRPGIGPK